MGSARRAPADIPIARRSRPGLVHFRLAERPSRDVHGDRRARRACGHHLRAVRDATPYPGTVDFERWEREVGAGAATVGGIPVTRHWLIPPADRRRARTSSVMSPDEIRRRTQAVADHFYGCPATDLAAIAGRPPWKGRLAFVLISKLYRQMYAQHRDCDRFRADARDRRRVRALDGGSVPPAPCRRPDPRPRRSPRLTFTIC